MKRLGLLGLAVAACSVSSPPSPPPPGPLGGEVKSSAFMAAATRAVWSADRSQLAVTIANYGLQCGAAMPQLQNGALDVTLAIPGMLAKAGTYAVRTSPAIGSQTMGATATRYTTDGAGRVTSQEAVLLQSGTVGIDSLSDSQLVGWLVATDNGVRLSGHFTASICPGS